VKNVNDAIQYEIFAISYNISCPVLIALVEIRQALPSHLANTSFIGDSGSYSSRARNDTDTNFILKLFLLFLRLLDLQTHLYRRNTRRFEDIIDFLQGQLERLGEDKVRDDQLYKVVHDVHTPDLIAQLVDSNTDTVVLNGSGGTLNQTVKTHTTCTEDEGEDLDGIKVVHGGNEQRGKDLKEEDPQDGQCSGSLVFVETVLP